MSVCVRCLRPTDIDSFLANDHVCDACAGMSDSEIAQRTLASEKQSTVPTEVQP